MKKTIFLVTILLTLVILYGNIPLSAEEGSYNTLSYNEWETMNEREKLLYTTGYIHGSFTVIHTIIRDLKLDEETSETLKTFITPYYNHDIVVAIDWLYSVRFFQGLTAYNLINNLDEYLRVRKAMYDESVGKLKHFKGELNND